MCVLCGELISNLHWSEIESSSTESQDIIVGEKQCDRMRQRLQKVMAC